MGTLQLRPEFFDVYLELAVDFGLPLRMGRRGGERVVGFPFRDLAADEGVVFPDHFVLRAGRRPPRDRAGRCSTCGRASPRSSCTRRSTPTSCAPSHPDWAGGSRTTRSCCDDPSFPRPASSGPGATLIGYRELRELQRSQA